MTTNVSESYLSIYEFHKFNCIRVRKGSKAALDCNWQLSQGVPHEYELLNGENIGKIASQFQIVIDCDAHIRGDIQQDGLGHLAALEKALGKLPETWTTRTPTNGKHLYFKTSRPFDKVIALHNEQIGMADIDVKGKGYTLLPPSYYAGDHSTPGGYYSWEIAPDDMDIAELPEPWLSYIEGYKAPNKQRTQGNKYEIKDRDRSLLDALLPTISPDIPYHDWIKVGMCLKNYYGNAGFDIWDIWSSGGSKYEAKANKEGMKKSWDQIRGVSEFGPVTVASLIHISNNSQQTTTPEYINMPQTSTKKAIEIPCDGLFKLIRDDVQRQMPKHSMYGYLCASVVLSTFAQRRIVSKKSAAMSFHVLAAGANSQKTTILQSIQSLINETSPSVSMPAPASRQALQRMFSEEASRFYGTDEGIDTLLNHYKSGRKLTTPYSEVINLMLQYFGSPKEIAGQVNKMAENNIRKTLAPRLCWLSVGVDKQFEALLGCEEFTTGGMASRFAPWTTESVFETGEEWISRTSSGVEWSEGTIEAIGARWGKSFPGVPDAVPSLVSIKMPDDIARGFLPFRERMEERAKSDEDRRSIWERMKERAVWYASVHAWSAERYEMTELDVEHGVALCEYHASVWDSFISNAEADDFTECMRSIAELAVKRGSLTKESMHQYIGRAFRGSQHTMLRNNAFSALRESGYFESAQPGVFLPNSKAQAFAAKKSKKRP